MKRILFIIALLLFVSVDFFAQMPIQIYGGDERLIFRENNFIEIRQRIQNHAWASNLFEQLKERVVKGAQVRNQDFSGVVTKSYWAEEAAIYYRICGDETYLPKIKEILVSYYKLKQPDVPLFNPNKPVSSYFWSRIMFDDCRLMTAYDLTKKHPIMRDIQNAFQVRMRESLFQANRYVDNIKRLGNTQFWGNTGLGLYGFMLGDEQTIEKAINGKWGFKAMLGKFRDEGLFWPEPKHYCFGYVDCCLLLLAETAKANSYKENLYEYSHPRNGASLKKMIHSLIESCTPDGYSLSNGEHSDYPNFANDTVLVERVGIFADQISRKNNKLPVYYRALKNDPIVGWAMAHFPDNDEYCVQYFGNPALYYGTHTDKILPPSAQSKVWEEMGDALIRSDETSSYWDVSRHPITVHIRNGASQQYHGENDHFSININCFGKNIYHHWFLDWDYLAPRKGRANSTPLSQRIINHNTVVTDFKEPDSTNIHYPQIKPERPGEKFSEISRSGNMKIISVEGEIYHGVKQKRTIAVVDEYVVDIFKLDSEAEHVYDYVLHSWGNVESFGNSTMTNYTRELNREYKFGTIDGKSKRSDNIWLFDAQKSDVKNDLAIHFFDSDNIGIYTQIVNNGQSEYITAFTPYIVTGEGWDASLREGIPSRKPMSIVRRKCKSTEFIVLHQPYKSQLKPYTIRYKDNILTVIGDTFVDTYDIKQMRYFRRN